MASYCVVSPAKVLTVLACTAELRLPAPHLAILSALERNRSQELSRKPNLAVWAFSILVSLLIKGFS